jgi:hypothetical protein
MDSLWERALNLAGEPLRTKNDDAFTFEQVSERCINVTVEGGGVHTVSRIQFDRADDAKLAIAGVTPKQLKDEAGVKKGQSYVAGIIHELVRRGL